MRSRSLLLKSSHRWLFLSFLFVVLLATACGTLRMDIVPTASPGARPSVSLTPTASSGARPNARPGVPLTPTAWFSELPPWANESGFTFDDRMKLLGFTVEPPSAGPGSAVTVTLIWQVLDKIDADYNTFVHVVNEAGQLLAQSDRPTGMGYRQPASWIVDELIYDQHQMLLPAGMSLDDVEIRVGLYDFAGGQRVDLDSPNRYTIQKVSTPTPEVTQTALPASKEFITPWVPGTAEPPAAPPPSQPVGELATGIPEVDRAIAVILENDIASRRDLVHFTTSGCTHVMGIGGPPKCEPGQEEGTPVEQFPILGHEGGHIAPEEIDQVLDFHAQSLYAAFRHKDEPDLEPTFAPGAYVSVFTTGDADGTNVLVHLNEDGKIVRLDTVDRFMALSLEEELERMVAEWLIGPP